MAEGRPWRRGADLEHDVRAPAAHLRLLSGRDAARLGAARGLDAAAYRYWDVDTHEWRSDPGSYELLVGVSAVDIRASAVVEWDGR